MAKTMTKRAQYIVDNYRLEQTSNGWKAVSMYNGRVFAQYECLTREECIRKARCQWGHFNYSDEAEAFATIFPPLGY